MKTNPNTNKYTRKQRHAYKVGFGAGIWGISLPDAISTQYYHECTAEEKTSMLEGYIVALTEIAQTSFESEASEND